eukprot:6460094-Amphidinium_carterae.3
MQQKFIVEQRTQGSIVPAYVLKHIKRCTITDSQNVPSNVGTGQPPFFQTPLLSPKSKTDLDKLVVNHVWVRDMLRATLEEQAEHLSRDNTPCKPWSCRMTNRRALVRKLTKLLVNCWTTKPRTDMESRQEEKTKPYDGRLL